jgi:hypothetical protein
MGMKAGMVVQIRVNPGDCQSVLDLLGLLNVNPYDGRSFAQCVSIALSSMLGSYRGTKVLPEVDTFQFLNRLGPFLESRNNKTKHAMAEALYRNGGRSVTTVELPKVEQPGQFVPETLRGWTEQGPVTTANVPLLLEVGDQELLVDALKKAEVDTLVEEFHTLRSKRSWNTLEKFRYEQIQVELDRRNKEGV